MKLIKEMSISDDLLEKYITGKIINKESDIFIEGNKELKEILTAMFSEYKIELQISRLGLVYFKDNQKNISRLYQIVPSMKYKEIDTEIVTLENIKLLSGSVYFSIEFNSKLYHFYPVIY
jgi:hypothetical protein